MSKMYHNGAKTPKPGTADRYNYTTKIVVIDGQEVPCKVYETFPDVYAQEQAELWRVIDEAPSDEE